METQTTTANAQVTTAAPRAAITPKKATPSKVAQKRFKKAKYSHWKAIWTLTAERAALGCVVQTALSGSYRDFFPLICEDGYEHGICELSYNLAQVIEGYSVEAIRYILLEFNPEVSWENNRPKLHSCDIQELLNGLHVTFDRQTVRL